MADANIEGNFLPSHLETYTKETLLRGVLVFVFLSLM